jgi:hypothetical protein
VIEPQPQNLPGDSEITTATTTAQPGFSSLNKPESDPPPTILHDMFHPAQCRTQHVDLNLLAAFVEKIV